MSLEMLSTSSQISPPPPLPSSSSKSSSSGTVIIVDGHHSVGLLFRILITLTIIIAFVDNSNAFFLNSSYNPAAITPFPSWTYHSKTSIPEYISSSSISSSLSSTIDEDDEPLLKSDIDDDDNVPLPIEENDEFFSDNKKSHITPLVQSNNHNDETFSSSSSSSSLSSSLSPSTEQNIELDISTKSQWSNLSIVERTSNTTSGLPQVLRTSALITCIVILVLGVTGNILVPFVVCRTRELCTNSTNVFLINLSIADLLVLMVCMPPVLVELYTDPEKWILGPFLCKFFFSCFIYLSIPHQQFHPLFMI